MANRCRVLMSRLFCWHARHMTPCFACMLETSHARVDHRASVAVLRMSEQLLSSKGSLENVGQLSWLAALCRMR